MRGCGGVRGGVGPACRRLGVTAAVGEMVGRAAADGWWWWGGGGGSGVLWWMHVSEAADGRMGALCG